MTATMLQHCENQPASARPERKILLVSTNLIRYGGAEAHVMQLAVLLRERGWNVRIVSMLPTGDLSAELLASDIPVVSLEMRRGFPDPRALRNLKTIIDRFAPDVVHSHMTHANLLARLVRPLTRVPVLISTLHGLHMNSVERRSTRLRELAHRATDRWADLTTTVCQAAADECLHNGSVPRGKILTVPNFVDTERHRPEPAIRAQMRRQLGIGGDFVWIAVGRLERVKDYATMIDAFAASRACRGAGVLLICGAGSQQPDLLRRIRDHHLDRRVRLLGVRHDLPALMAAADGYVMSSRTEGLPMALLEASACALPIVATNVGGNPEVVAPGETGYLVDPGDADALARAIERVAVLATADRLAMGLAGRARTELLFSKHRIGARWEELYEMFLTSKQSKYREKY